MKPKTNPKTQPATAATLLLLLSSLTAPAAVITNHWIGATDGRWSNTNNWHTGRVPNSFRGGPEWDVFWTNHPVTVTLDGDQYVLIRNFTFTTAGTLMGTNLDISGDLEWSCGVMAGGYTAVGHNATLHGSAPDYLLLENRPFTFGGTTRLSSVLRVNNRAGVSPRTYLSIASWAGPFEVLDGAAIEMVPPSLASDSDVQTTTTGLFRILDGATSFRCEGGFHNQGLVEVGDRTAVFAAGFRQSLGTLQLNNGRIETPPAPLGVNLTGGSLQGTGVVTRATLGSPVAWRTPVLSGQIHFSELSVNSGAKVRVSLGGRERDRYDHFRIGNAVTLGGRLEVGFTNGFETSILPTDEFEIFTLDPGCTRAGAFQNVAFGNRVWTADGAGSFLLHAPASPESGPIVLRDYSSDPVVLQLASEAALYPFPPGVCHVDPAARVFVGPGGVDWDGGSLEAAVIGGFDALQDRLEVENEGDLAGQIRVSWLDADDGEAFFGGARFATVQRRDAAGLLFAFGSSATTAAIEALVRQLVYANSVFSADAFTGPSIEFPARTIELALADGAGHRATTERQIEIPALSGFHLSPGAVTLYAGEYEWVELVGEFSPLGEFQPLPRWQPTTWSTDRDPAPIGLDVDPLFPGRVLVRLSSQGVCTLTAQVGTRSFSINVTTWNRRRDCALAAFLQAWQCLAFPAFCSGGSSFARSAAAQEPAPSAVSLASFRALETLMKETDEGRRLVNLYWKHGPEAVQILQSDTNRLLQFGTVLTNFQPLVAALLAGRGEQAQITQAMIDQLNSVWTTLTNYAGPTLKAALDSERARFHGFQDFVDQDFSQWAQRLQIPAPTNAWMHISSIGFTKGQLSLEANAVNGWNVSLWRASDLTLKNWEPVPGTQMETNGYTLRLTDTNPPPPQRFYQLRAQPCTP
ncbi:MAG: hypothetical protein HZA90_29110 [Verrucomicrobia bacterium]|nr:hypothetical protein [Verrucomicrobiota bacterium]